MKQDAIYTEHPFDFGKPKYDFDTYKRLVKESLVKFNRFSEKCAEKEMEYYGDKDLNEFYNDNLTPACSAFGMSIRFL